MRPSQRPTTDHSAEMAQFLKGHADLAKIVLEILKDESIPLAAKAPAIAAARYNGEDNDLIPDDVPLFGRIDDVYITAIALDETFKALGERGTDVGERKLGDGDRLGGRLTSMQVRFNGFWHYCKKAAEPFIQKNLEHYRAHPEQLPDLCASFAKEVAEIEKTCAAPIQLNAKEVERFVAQFRRAVVEE